MNPFVHLPEYHVVVCTGKECKYAVLPSHIDSHLNRSHHNYNQVQRKQVVQEIQQVEGLIQDVGGLQSFKFPKPNNPAIPELRSAMPDGLQCRSCSHICRNERQMRAYCAGKHQWNNERKKGRP
jgi:hypothetical protein